MCDKGFNCPKILTRECKKHSKEEIIQALQLSLHYELWNSMVRGAYEGLSTPGVKEKGFDSFHKDGEDFLTSISKQNEIEFDAHLDQIYPQEPSDDEAIYEDFDKFCDDSDDGQTGYWYPPTQIL